jgi:hypothetical protein
MAGYACRSAFAEAGRHGSDEPQRACVAAERSRKVIIMRKRLLSMVFEIATVALFFAAGVALTYGALTLR